MIQDYSYGSPKAKIKKDYQIKQFVNPYFGKKKRAFNTQLYIRIILVIFVVYLVVYSDLLKIRDISVSGTNIINPEEIKDIVKEDLKQNYFLIIPENNLLFLNKEKIATDISHKFSVNKLEIKRGWQKLKITLEEKVSSLIIYNSHNFYLSDSDGTITKEITGDEINKYLNTYPVLNIAKEQINIGDQVTNAKAINYLIDLDKNLRSDKFGVKGYESRGVDEITFVASENWRVYFDVGSNVTSSIDNLLTILKQKVPDKNKLNYIDLRFGDKVFLCFRGESCN